MTWTERRKRLRQYLAGDGCISPAAIYDAASARIAADIGYEALILPGSTVSLTVLAAPDMALLTLSELAEQTSRISRACDLPLIVDADHGYGNALNVRRTVEELENAGAAAISLLDTAWPPQFGGAGASTLLSIEEGVGKLRAALDARSDPSLLIVGRTDAAVITNFDDMLRRAVAYENTGVDALFLYGITGRSEVEALRAVLKLPLILGGSKQGLEDRSYLASQGVRVITQNSLPVLAALHAVHVTLRALRDGTQPMAIENLASKELMKKVLREEDYARWARDYLI